MAVLDRMTLSTVSLPFDNPNMRVPGGGYRSVLDIYREIASGETYNNGDLIYCSVPVPLTETWVLRYAGLSAVTAGTGKGRFALYHQYQSSLKSTDGGPFEVREGTYYTEQIFYKDSVESAQLYLPNRVGDSAVQYGTRTCPPGDVLQMTVFAVNGNWAPGDYWEVILVVDRYPNRLERDPVYRGSTRDWERDAAYHDLVVRPAEELS